MPITLKFTKTELIQHCENRIAILTKDWEQLHEQSVAIDEILTSINAYYKQLEENTRNLFERSDILSSISKVIITSKYYQTQGPSGPVGASGPSGPSGFTGVESGEELVDKIKRQSAEINYKIDVTRQKIDKYNVVKDHLRDDEYSLDMHEAERFELLKN